MTEKQAPYELKVDDRRFKEEESTNLPTTTDPNAVLIMAMQKGYTPELIKQMMDLSERHEANEARKAYHNAMANFAASPPDIEKDKKVSYSTSKGTTAYSHAQLGTSAAKIQSALSPHGLHASWRTVQTEKNIKVICRITHKLGHFEETDLSAGADDSGSKNSIQAIGSTISYLERYTLFALTGIASKDMDDDGIRSEETKYITLDQQTEINDLLLMVYPLDQGAAFCKWLGVEDTEIIPAGMYKKALAALNAAKNQMKSKRKSGDET